MHRPDEQFQEGGLIYLSAPTALSMETDTMKFRLDFSGPLVVDTVTNSTHYKFNNM